MVTSSGSDATGNLSAGRFGGIGIGKSSGMGSAKLPPLPIEEPTPTPMEGLTRRQILRRRQNQRRQMRNQRRNLKRGDRRENQWRNPPNQDLGQEHYQLIRQHMREDGILHEGDPLASTVRQENPPGRSRDRKRTHTQMNSVSHPSTQDQKDSTRRSTSLCWRRRGAETDSTSETASSTEKTSPGEPSANTSDDSSSSGERENGPKPASRLGLRLIKACLLLILGLYLMMSTPQASAASSSEPLLFENVGEVVTGLSYVHSVIPVDIAGFEKHLVDYQATLEREFDNATLEQTHRDFMQTVQAQSKVTKTTSSLNFDRSMIAKWREIGETHVGQVKELRKKVMALYEAVPPVHLDDKPNEQFAVPTDAVVQ
jgi:hypothetical protein